MKKTKIVIGAIALSLGFMGAAISAANAYSHSETLETGTNVTANFTKSGNKFTLSLNASDTCTSMGVTLSRMDSNEDFHDMGRKIGHKVSSVVTQGRAKSSDLVILGCCSVNDSGTKWHHNIEYEDGVFSPQ